MPLLSSVFATRLAHAALALTATPQLRGTPAEFMAALGDTPAQMLAAG